MIVYKGRLLKKSSNQKSKLVLSTSKMFEFKYESDMNIYVLDICEHSY